jgi:hypothetical protein
MRLLWPLRGTLALVGALCAVLVASLATAGARPRRIVWGSNLRATPHSIANARFAADTEFWNTALGGARVRGVRHVTGAPRAGKVVAIKLKTGDDSQPINIRISVIRRTGGNHFTVITTSTPHWTLPAHSRGIHTFSTAGLSFAIPLKRGDLVALSTPGVRRSASVWFGSVGGSTTDLFSAPGPTQNQGATWTGSRRPGVELLLQVIEQPS